MPDKIACSLWGDDVGSGVGGLPPRSALAVKEFVWFGVGELCPFFESQLSDYRIVNAEPVWRCVCKFPFPPPPAFMSQRRGTSALT